MEVGQGGGGGRPAARGGRGQRPLRAQVGRRVGGVDDALETVQTPSVTALSLK